MIRLLEQGRRAVAECRCVALAVPSLGERHGAMIALPA